VQVCALNRCCEHQRTHFATGCAYALMYVQFVYLALGEPGWGGSASL